MRRRKDRERKEKRELVYDDVCKSLDLIYMATLNLVSCSSFTEFDIRSPSIGEIQVI